MYQGTTRATTCPADDHHAHGRDDGTWDAMRLYGCVCDSSWPVGLGPGETQESRILRALGATLSIRRRCRHQRARARQGAVTGVLAKGGHGVGEPGS